MKIKSLTEVFLEYVKKQRKVIGILMVFDMIFCLQFFLYSLPLEPILYAGLLCFVIGLCWMGIDFTFYRKRHQMLKKIYKNIHLLLDELPVPLDLVEEDYQNVIRELEQEKAQLLFKSDEEKTTLLDYYTLWVHQVKTPIAAMRLLLETEEFQGKQEIGAELFQIEQYVEMVLQSMRFFSNTSDFVFKKYQLEDIIRQAVRKYAKIFIRKKISLDLRAVFCEVITDEKWLLFVIEQILSNALKYTKEGTISIYLDERQEKTLVIEDTGIGIYPEDLPRVCDKGFTGYNGRSDKKSTGIGLYLCKEVLSKMQHTIHIESVVGEGTKVKISLANAGVEMRYE